MLMGRKQGLLLTAVLAGVTLQAASLRADLTYTGDVTPTPPSSWTTSTSAYVGNTADGTLTLSAGSTAAAGVFYVGYHLGATGIATVDGTGSILTINGTSYVGYQGIGHLHVTNGGTLSGAGFNLGTSNSGYLSVADNGSTMSATSFVNINNGGLFITNGGSAKTQGISLVAGGSATGTVTVDGANSILVNAGNFYLTGTIQNKLNISNGATINNSETLSCYYRSAAGSIDFGSYGGTINTKNLGIWQNQVVGTGTINTHGMLFDFDQVLDASSTQVQNLHWTSSNQDVTVNYDYGATNAGDLYSGYNNTAHVTIQNGVTVNSSTGYLGYNSGSNGTVTVAGAGSNWAVKLARIGSAGIGILNINDGGTLSTDNVNLGGSSAGTLNIDGGTVNVSTTLTTWCPIGLLHMPTGTLKTAADYQYYTTYDTHGSGQIVFGANGGIINSKNLLVAPSQLMGSGVINTQGLVSDIDLVCNTNQGATQTLQLQNTTINLDLSGTTKPAGTLGAGYIGSGSLLITGPTQVNSSDGVLGYWAGSQGSANVDGSVSQWKISSLLTVGKYGNGVLNISNGGNVQTSSAEVGSAKGSSGIINVNGNNSRFSISSNLSVSSTNSDTTGVINITNGGSATVANEVYLGWYYNGNATLNISGAGSSFNSGQISSTGAGTANINITGGGTATSTTAHLNFYYNVLSTVNIDGAGSTWTINPGGSWTPYTFDTGYLIIDQQTGGSKITISNGGHLINNGNSSFSAGQGYTTPSSAGSSTTDITVDGNGSSWTNNGTMAYYGRGTIAVDHGGSLGVTGTFLQYHASKLLITNGGTFTCGSGINSNGTLLVSDPGSLLTTSGLSTNLKLNVLNGGQVVNKSTYSIYGSTNWSNPLISPTGLTIDGINSSMQNTKAFSASGYTQIMVQHGGQLFNSSTFSLGGANYYAANIQPSRLVVDGSNSLVQNTGNFTANGYTQTLIQNGGRLINKANYSITGLSQSSTPTANYPRTQLLIDGANSSMQNTGNFTASGYTQIQVGNGGYLSAAGASLTNGAFADVRDTGSKWVTSQTLSLTGGSLYLSHGGLVQANTLSLDSSSRLNLVQGCLVQTQALSNSGKISMNVDDGSTITVSGGTLTNNYGTLQIKANALSASGVAYSPITAPTWSGSVTMQTLGGTWNSTTHKFTSSAMTNAIIGNALTINTQSAQRVMFKSSDQTTNIVGLSLLATSASTNLTITAAMLSDNLIQTFLASQPATTQVVTGANVTFSGTGYSSSSAVPVYYTFPINSIQKPANFAFWIYVNGTWQDYGTPTDFYYDGAAAYFSTTTLSPYLITTTIPEPASLAILSLAAGGLLRRRKYA